MNSLNLKQDSLLNEQTFFYYLNYIYKRNDANKSKRQLSISLEAKKNLYEEAITFLKLFQSTHFEIDNLSHIHRLLQLVRDFEHPLLEHLGVDKEDLELLIVLHDLGKTLIDPQIYNFLLQFFDKNDFLNLRVIPHELYSMVWIDKLGKKLSISEDNLSVLKDLIANHNLGPNPLEPQFSNLLSKDSQNQYHHWWVQNWHLFITELNRAGGYHLPLHYGYTDSCLATCLVFIDRLDAASIHAWEKYLNQDLIVGSFEFTPTSILTLLNRAHLDTQEQIKMIKKQLGNYFLKKINIENFDPFKKADVLLKNCEHYLSQLKTANLSITDSLKIKNSNLPTVYYLNKKNDWLAVTENTTKQYDCFKNEDGKWKKIITQSNPIDALFHFLFVNP